MTNTSTINLSISGFSNDLLDWYRKNARALPWRQTNNPYAIWVSEVMLQQTRVETVIPYYQQFLKQFPSIKALAEAPEAEVLKAWEGLGYYRRARLLIQGAKVIVDRFNGKLPQNEANLRSIPGIGPYMAGALASIAFNLPVPAVDGNVIRVVTRILAWPEIAETARSKKTLTNWVYSQFPPESPRDFNQALMELGALLCIPKNPHCHECPVRTYCQAVLNNPERYPVKKDRKEIPTERRIVLQITWNGRHLLIQRPSKGLMAGFWEYPSLTANFNDDALNLARIWSLEQLGKTLEFSFQREMTHVYTHLRWELELYQADWSQEFPPLELPNSGWFLPEAEKKLPRVAYIRQYQY